MEDSKNARTQDQGDIGTQDDSDRTRSRGKEEDMMQLVDELRRKEESGELYVTNVEIIFPPQVKAKYGLDGVIVDIWTVLNSLADLYEDDEHSEMLRNIAAEFYPPEDEEYDEEDEEYWALDDEESEMLEQLVHELDQESGAI